MILAPGELDVFRLLWKCAQLCASVYRNPLMTTLYTFCIIFSFRCKADSIRCGNVLKVFKQTCILRLLIPYPWLQPVLFPKCIAKRWASFQPQLFGSKNNCSNRPSVSKYLSASMRTTSPWFNCGTVSVNFQQIWSVCKWYSLFH